MKFAELLCLTACGLLGVARGSVAYADAEGPERTWLRQTLAHHCFDCHGADTQEAELNLEGALANASDVEHEPSWASIIKMAIERAMSMNFNRGFFLGRPSLLIATLDSDIDCYWETKVIYSLHFEKMSS